MKCTTKKLIHTLEKKNKFLFSSKPQQIVQYIRMIKELAELKKQNAVC
jgi:hypothetical protein